MTNLKQFLAILVAVGSAIGLTGGVAAAELDGPAQIVFDQYRVPTIIATTEHDAIYLQGYMHARDRLFQMDLQRRLFSGRLAELVGPSAIPQDVQLRTLGLRRAAERSLLVQTPETLAWLDAYAAGVNAYLQDESIPLPIEFTVLETTRAGIPPWTPTDSLTMAKGLAFGLSFDLGDIDRTLALLNFRGVGEVLGFNGLQLFNNDLYPPRPFDPTISIPPGSLAPEETPQLPEDDDFPDYIDDPAFADLVQSYRDTIVDIPILRQALERDSSEQGSNWWVVAGSLTDSGFPMIANDPHLSLGTPSTFYENHLVVPGVLNVTGTSFPGAPGIVLGCNETICWGATVNALDVTDVYNEVLAPLDPNQPTTPTHTIRNGVPEPLQFIPQTFMFNAIGDGVPNTLINAGVPATSGGVTMIVPRRNNGPIVQVSFNPASPTPLTGISVAYTGWSATQELEAFRRFARSTSMQDFKDALQYFDVGSQNWSYADINGNIAYYTSGELPIREDLQTLFFPDGLQPPYLIRDGTHTRKHDWLPLQNPQPHQALSTEILPFNEMPQIENPAAGYILNANNDPIGTTLDNVSWNQFRAGFNGLLYLAPGYAPGYRIGRLQQLFDDALASGPLTVAHSKAFQANNQLLDAEVLSPYLIDAFSNASAPGADPQLAALAADPAIAEAIARIANWDFSTPTGIAQGFDPGDNPAALAAPSAAEVEASIAATIYSVWRGQILQRTIDHTLASLPVPLTAFAPSSDRAMIALRQFLDNYSVNGGTGASLLNFFVVPGVFDQNIARDIILLQSLRNGLDLLASPTMSPAFGGSTDQNDYRWGMLHRIVFAHPLGGPFSLPPAGSPANLAPNLPGFARAGGMGALDASSHNARADGLNEFMFGSGPSRRFIATMAPTGPQALEVIPGGQSGTPGSPNQADQLALWLVNEYKQLPISLADVDATAVATEEYACGDGVVGPGEQCDDGNANNADGCNDACRLVPTITCGNPSASADAQTCTASIACEAIASCVDPSGNALPVTCDTASPFGLGTTNVAVGCSDGLEMSMTVCQTTVIDTTAPSIDVFLSPDSLWPPNHRMVEIEATVSSDDACGATTLTLDSLTSSEPDNAPGGSDGNTVNDIQNAEIGTADFLFDLRAERAGGGSGRTYTATYTATDGSGNQSSASAVVTVAHNRGGVAEPLILSLEENEHGTKVSWQDQNQSPSYNVIRGSLSNIAENGHAYVLGEVICIESASIDTDTGGYEDAALPAPGEAFFYLVEFDDEYESSYGTESAAKPRLPLGGACQ